MNRIHSFDDVVGHTNLIPYFKHHIKQGTFPKFVIIDGQEGLGKTTLADLTAISLAYGENATPDIIRTVIDEKHSTDLIKKFVMSIDGGKDAARNVVEELSAPLNSNAVKVVICDECQGLSTAAQDVFLSETEYLAKNVYLIMLTTEPQILRPALRSRATPIHLNPLKTAEMVRLLTNYANNNELNIQGGAATLQLIADWADNKPRTGLSILSAFSKGESISDNTIREMIGYMSIDEVLPLIESLSTSVIRGLSIINEMDISQSIIIYVTEIIRVLCGEQSYRLKYIDVKKINSQLSDIPVDNLVKFLYGLTRESVLTKPLLINAYLYAHCNFKELQETPTGELFATEEIQRTNNVLSLESSSTSAVKAPTLESLLMNSAIVDTEDL